MRWRRIYYGLVLILVVCQTLDNASWSAEEVTAERPAPERWQKTMDAFAAADLESPTAPDGIVFVGSSSIRMWNLDKSFPDLPALNRGFGGSHIADATHYLDVLVLRHKPQVVVFYAGDNDMARGLSTADVVADYGAFVKKLQTALPETRLVYVAIKPSISRWTLYPRMGETNRQIAEIAAADPLQTFADIATPMLGDDGKPRAELFLEDGLHLNKEGYELWTSLVRPHLKLRAAAK
jgi:lysophospholipase L1-like esterase